MAKKNKKVIGEFELPEISNSCKTLLANIRFSGIDKPLKSIVITSSIMDEGKSTVCSNLSLSIAGSGKRVLLMDCDLRRRSLGHMLGMENNLGIYSVLSGEASLKKAIVETKYPNLYFLDSESNVVNPADIFATRRFSALIDKVSSLFDYVIIDTPPVGLFIDAAVISNVVDGTALCVRMNNTKREMIKKSLQQLEAAEANVLGFVCTFCESKGDSYYYYRYYNSEGKRISKKEKNRIMSTMIYSSTASSAIQDVAYKQLSTNPENQGTISQKSMAHGGEDKTTQHFEETTSGKHSNQESVHGKHQGKDLFEPGTFMN